MDLCMAAERHPGSRKAKRWQEQEGLDLEGMQTADWGTEREEREEETDATETEKD